MSQNSKMLIGAVIAAVLAIAVYYGAINQNQANNYQNQANHALGTAPASQTAPGNSAATNNSTASAPASPAPQSTATGPVGSSQTSVAPAQH